MTTPKVTTDPLVGKVLGHYRLVKFLGAGGMGVVYRAHDERLRRDVAIKLLPERHFDEERRKQFRQEAEALAKLNHPNIAIIYDFDCEGTTDYLVMELLTGSTLAERLSGGPLAPNLVTKFGLQIAEGLEAAHRQGILHRDLKPGNVGFTSDDRVKILDFGLAKFVSSDPLDETRSATSPGFAKGTVAYMAPEQLRGEVVDVRADIYSAGATLYEMAAGRAAHAHVSGALLINAVLNESPVSPSTLNRNVSPQLQAVILKAMDKDPEQRYKSAEELGQDLQCLSTATAPIAAKQASKKRLRKVLWPGVAFLCVLVAAIAGWKGYERLQNHPSATSRPLILVGDFDNHTGEPVFDGTLQEMFSSALEQSQAVEIFPTSRLVDALKRMGLSATHSIDENTGRELSVREGLQGVLLGSIAKLGQKYVLLARVESPSGNNIVSAEATAESADQIPSKVDEIAATMRQKLGESPGAVKDNSVPLAKVSSSSLDAVRYFTLGKQALYNGDPTQAVLMFGKAVELDPNFAMAHAYLGVSYEHLNQYALESEQLAQAARLADRVSEPERLRIMGAYYATQLDFVKACENYQLLAQLVPEDPVPYVNIGVCKKDLQDYNAAVSYTEKALKFVPQSGVRVNLASQLAVQGNLERALDVAIPFSREFPNDPFAQGVLGRIYLGLGRTEDARQTFTGMTRSGGDSEVTGRLFLADMALSAGQYEEAEKEFKTAAVAADTSHNSVAAVKARVALAEMRLQNKQHSQSNRGALSDIELPPNAPALNLLLGRVYAWMGDMDSARRQLQALDARINQNDVPAVESLRHLLAAEIALAQRNFTSAVDMAQQAANYQNSIFAVETLARCYAAAGMYDQAVQEYELLLTRSSELLDDTSNETFDQPAFRRAVEAHYRLAELYQKLGRTEQARTHLQTSLKYWSHPDPKFLMYEDAQRLLRSLSAGRVPTPAM